MLSHSTMPQMSQVFTERAIGMMTARISTRAVTRELNVNFSTISHLQRRFREFGSPSKRPHNRRPRVIVMRGLAKTSPESASSNYLSTRQPPAPIFLSDLDNRTRQSHSGFVRK